MERLAKRAGLASPNLTTAQRALPIVGQVRWAGGLIGVVFGCILGLVNLFFIDTGRSATLKLQAFNEEQGMILFYISASFIRFYEYHSPHGFVTIMFFRI